MRGNGGGTISAGGGAGARRGAAACRAILRARGQHGRAPFLPAPALSDGMRLFDGSSACDGSRCGRREEARRGCGRPAAQQPAAASLRRAPAGTPPRRPRCAWQTTPAWTLTSRAPLVRCFVREGQGTGGGFRLGRGRLGRTRWICRPSALLEPPPPGFCVVLAPHFPLACPPLPPLGDRARSGEARF